MNGKNKFLNMLIILLAVLVFTGCGSGSADFKKESPDSLDGKRVGIVTGSSYDKNITKNYPGAKIKFFASTTDMITALKTNKIDAFIEDKPKAELILRQDDSLTSNDTGFGNFDMAYIFARTPKGALLCGKFDKFIEEQRKNGNLKKLEQKWLGDDESQKIPPDPGTLAVNTEVLDMATEGESAPFSYIKDGKYAGYDIELAYMFCKENGYALEVKNMAHDALIPAVDSDKCDFAGAGIDVTGERSEEIYFSKPTYNTGSAVVTVKVKETKQGLILRLKDGFIKTFLTEQRYRLFAQGMYVTMMITVTSLILGTLLGFFVYLMCRGGNVFANKAADLANFIITGTPEVVLLMVLFYVVFAKIAVDGVWAAILCFTLTFGASMYSMLCGGVAAISRGQSEAAYSLGFSDNQTFFKIILPQAARHIIPSYRSELVSHIKNTAIVGYVAVQDLTKMGDIVRSRTYEAFYPLIAVTVMYFLLTAILNYIIDIIDRKTDPRLRSPAQILKGIKTDDNT